MGYRKFGRVLLPEDTPTRWPEGMEELWLELHEASPNDVYSRFDVPYAAVSPRLQKRIHLSNFGINVFDINHEMFELYRRGPVENRAIYNKINRGEAILLNRPAMSKINYRTARQEYPFWVRN